MTCLFLVATLHTAVTLRMLLDAFVDKKGGPPGPDAYFGNFSLVTQKLHLTAYFINLLLADGLLLWRLWVVWERKLMVWVVPAVAYLALIVCDAIAMEEVWSIPASNPLLFFTRNQFITATQILTISLNSLVTLLLAIKTYGVHRDVFTSIVESAVIYTVTNATSLGLYREHAKAGSVSEAAAVQIAGIAPALILLRAALRRSTTSVTSKHSVQVYKSTDIYRPPPVPLKAMRPSGPSDDDSFRNGRQGEFKSGFAV